MSFDPMARAIDWLDAYRAADISIVSLYADDAAIECACERATFIGYSAIESYWRRRFFQKPAGELVNLYMDDDAVALSYRTRDETVLAALRFDDSGRIVRTRCGPLIGTAPD
jgi:hypothetical protein